jgi:protoheme IX farnesyltransferase
MTAASEPARGVALGDLLALAKPRITALVVFTTASGLWLAPRGLSAAGVALTLVGTVLIVAGANTLNMYLERDSDALMARTAGRPLPAGRMDPAVALRLGIGLSVLSVPLLTFAVGPLPGLLASIALVSYVLLYTLMFLWQVPHFLAITLFRKGEYARAGLVVQPNEPGGERAARANIVRYTVALVGVSLLFVPIGVAGRLYLVTALVAGAAFLGYGLLGLRENAGTRWARNLFFLSLVYLTALFAVLMVDRIG